MHSLTTAALVALLPLVSAHGHVDKVIADGVTYQGWNAALKYDNPIPATVGWQADNLDNGFVTPDRFGTVDIVCHKLGKSNGAYVPVKPGSKVTFKWDTWPVSHAGKHLHHPNPTQPFQHLMYRHHRDRMCRLLITSTRPGTRVHSRLQRRLRCREARIPPVDQNTIRRLEIRQQPGCMGDGRPGKKQLQLGPNDPESRTRQLRYPARNHRSARCRSAERRPGLSSVREFQGRGQWHDDVEWRCAGDELL